jgi:hypothetical protein
MVPETKALVVRPVLTPAVTPDVWSMIMNIGMATYKARTLGSHSAEETAIKMLVAHEHGVPLSSALSSVYVIDNKPALAPVLVWAKIVQHPEFAGDEEERLTTSDGAFFGWRITLKRGNKVRTREFTLDDARRIVAGAGGKKLIDKDNWQNYGEDVCYWRAMARVQKVVFPDVTMGLSTAGELGADVDATGTVIEGQWSTATPLPQPPTVAGCETIEALLDRWTADEIVAANNGLIPATAEECQAVAVKLNQAELHELQEQADATGT